MARMWLSHGMSIVWNSVMAIRAALPFKQMALMGEKQRDLHEEDRERFPCR
jgi:hypothetical protein